MITCQFVNFVVFIILFHKKIVVNGKLKIVIEKKRNNEMVGDIHGEIKLMRIVNLVKKLHDLVRGRNFFFPTFLVLRVRTCIKVRVFFLSR